MHQLISLLFKPTTVSTIVCWGISVVAQAVCAVTVIVSAGSGTSTAKVAAWTMAILPVIVLAKTVHWLYHIHKQPRFNLAKKPQCFRLS